MLLLFLRVQHADGRRTRAEPAVRGSADQAYRSQSIQRQLRRSRMRQLCPCGQVGRPAHPGKSLSDCGAVN